eukprot:TRINITY_DN1784_c0_g1_i6.p1 TRINITY_DN1784_c0_g1~~TRINITY_DN1784_c0_g1_i6.p1  ORF type:complete len:125 (+),score=33.70 TRINITY_DN1784_c0_g1_i6:154-528(+)
MNDGVSLLFSLRNPSSPFDSPWEALAVFDESDLKSDTIYLLFPMGGESQKAYLWTGKDYPLRYFVGGAYFEAVKDVDGFAKRVMDGFKDRGYLERLPENVTVLVEMEEEESSGWKESFGFGGEG